MCQVRRENELVQTMISNLRDMLLLQPTRAHSHLKAEVEPIPVRRSNISNSNNLPSALLTSINNNKSKL